MTPALARFYDARADAYGLGRGDNVHTHVIARVGSGRRVLDVGCGSGLLGAELVARGNRVTGVELSPAAAARARARLDHVVVGSVEELELPFAPGAFDVVLACDVLEHLFDPEAALRRLRPLVAPGGELLVSLPNVAHFSLRLELLRGRWEYEEIGLLDRGHLRFFTRASAERLARQAGFEVAGLDWVTSLPNAGRRSRRAIALARRLPRRWQERLAGLIAVQFVLALRPR